MAVSEPMREVLAAIARLAPSRATVLVTGEPGTGKSRVVRAIHDASRRATGPFVAVDCRTLAPDAFECRLFGGSPYGAETCSQPGAVREADRGTLFLREISALPLLVQPRFLRFLDDGEPVGDGNGVRPSDVRVLASTSADLGACVTKGSLRRDLGERIELVRLEVPPLRARRDDVVPLALELLGEEQAGEHERALFSPDALAALLAQPFPGNVAELRERIRKALKSAPAGARVERFHLEIL